MANKGSFGPPGRGDHISWEQVPERVRSAIEDRLGGRVVRASSRPGGFSPGLAAVLERADGTKAFVKSVGPELNTDSPDIHRREIYNVARLPEGIPVPEPLWSLDEGPGGWVTLAFRAIDGREPLIPWVESELDRVCRTLNELGAKLTPAPFTTPPGRSLVEVFEGSICGWRRIASEPGFPLDDWSRRHLQRLAKLELESPCAVDGVSLVHLDTRADNILVTDSEIYLVDWPHACTGAAWVEFVAFAPSVAMQGGPDPESLMRRFPSAMAADPAAITAAVASIAGYFTWQAAQPPPKGIPSVRPFQAAQGEVARSWLRARTGW